MGKIPELSIFPDKVFFIVSKARQSDFGADEPDLISGLTDDDTVHLHTKEVREHADQSTSAQGSAAPGKVHASVGTARSAVEQTDWHDDAERSFLKSLAERLHQAVSADETRGLTMVASPRGSG
jgi:protein required for attachment to host cells